ncbi:sulfite exporter TauE/SafE family protein [Frankia sp. CcI49]|uniref:sulfite exporter TauE/SafE family protein n=1 Tax=Frankia sp. CcI49 TaxID=1745382 RepID=UPI002410D0E6|nr:sulfite exporter TauE/SafE family protein [Frankia sp. CcI49]
MSAADVALLVGAGILAGITSTVAGLASLVSYPALLAVGLEPRTANMTNTAALLFVALGAALGSRTELAGQGGRVARFGAATLTGGALGAVLLMTTPARAFELVVPWLIVGAAVLLVLSPRLRPAAGDTAAGPLGPRGPGLLAAVFAVSIYTGYFGAGAGVALLAIMAVMIPEPLARVNAVKNVASGFSNAVAAVLFAVVGSVAWTAAAPLAAGLLAGGAIGPRIVRALPAELLRWIIAAAAVGLAVSLGLDAYR